MALATRKGATYLAHISKALNLVFLFQVELRQKKCAAISGMNR